VPVVRGVKYRRPAGEYQTLIEKADEQAR